MSSDQEADLKAAVDGLPAGMQGLVSEAIDFVKRLKTLEERGASESQGSGCFAIVPASCCFLFRHPGRSSKAAWR